LQEDVNEHFGKVLTPENIGELLELCGGSLEHCEPVRMWRGQSNEAWPIHSGAYRRVALGGGVADESRIFRYEGRLLDHATHRGFRWYEGRELSDFELLARLQHHGAATRLIDTTRNAMVGLYFACVSSPDQNGLLFGIHSNYLGGGEASLLERNYKNVIDQIAKYNHPQTWEPPSVSKRISAQHSQFVYSKVVVGQPVGSLALEPVEKSLRVIRIIATMKQAYLTYIERVFDIHVQSMFPDLEGFGMTHSHSRDEYANYRW
jgi:hypothetical protein